MELTDKLANETIKAFEGRFELMSSRHRATSLKIVLRNVCFWKDNTGAVLDDDGKMVIHPNMLMLPQTSASDLISNAKREALEYGSKIFGIPSPYMDVKELAVMFNGSGTPIRADLSQKDNEKNRTIFIKNFDPNRVIGLDMYSMIGNVGRDYAFLFNNEIITEEGIPGFHPRDLASLAKRDSGIIRERIKLDAVSFFMGLDDLAKPDNSIVTPDKRLVCIDCESMDHPYTPEEIQRYKAGTAQDLGIDKRAYDSIFDEENSLLERRVLDNGDRIIKLADLLKMNPPHFGSYRVADYILERIAKIQRNKTSGGYT